MQWPIFVVVLCSAFAKNAAALELTKLMDQCFQQYSVDGNDILGTFFMTGEIPDESDKNAQCIFLCLAKKLIHADDDGHINLPAANEMFVSRYSAAMTPADVNALIEKCAIRRETDLCEKVYQFSKCHMKAYLSIMTS